MYDEPFDEDIDSAVYTQMHHVMRLALDKVLNQISSDEFLSWAQSSLPELAPAIFDGFTIDDIPGAAYWMAVNLWNAAPQPENHFKPTPLDKPSRNSPCPCGSGLKYKQCCSRRPPLEPLHTDAFWSVMPLAMPKTQINRLCKNHQLPAHAIASMASFFSDEGDAAQVVKMLDVLFEGSASRINHRYSGLLDMLCDNYNLHYKTDKKKNSLLDRMIHHKDRVIRAEAWQRIASMQQDLGNNQQALDALTEAMRADPDNPSHSLLELTLLIDSNRIEHARQRAGFWLHKLKHYKNDYPDLIDTLKQAQTDPRSAIQSRLSNNDQQLTRLLKWISSKANTPAAQYTQNFGIDLNEDEDQIKGSLHQRLLNQGVEPDEIKRLLDELHLDKHLDGDPEFEDYYDDEDDDLTSADDMMENAVCLQAPQNIATLDMMWFGISPLEKPFSVFFEANGGIEAWQNGFETQWLTFLEENPETINSLDILDDITTLIYMHPHNNTHWGPINNIQPLLDQAENIIHQANIPADSTLPWIMPENRPALRLLAHNINLATDHGNQPAAIEKIQLYLKLNPQDNHGYRSMLINYYLQQGMNQQALSLSENYLEDPLAETRFGRVLALYRLDKLQAAAKALEGANDTLPLIAKYLLKTKAAQPRFSEQGIRFGGKDQAWIYREEMRDSWLQTEGCMSWLKKQIV
ncbi:hypothetical protein MNBD_GAMMA09-2100 [hydrothermal vent metagenome]|uniref:Uncharacterized protein n=1 Tax=hydrothermal vent metagenome TaxID=652676 RepID=A0A3B0Y5H4_9ZZZZ